MFLSWRVERIVLAFAVTMASASSAFEVSQEEWDSMKKEMTELRKKQSAPIKQSDVIIDKKLGPNAQVTTKAGKLTISGLVQVWYHSIENDNKGLFQDAEVNNITDTGEVIDNDTFRNRRTELKFIMEITNNIRAEVMIDPAREAQSFPNASANTGTAKRAGGQANVANIQGGVGAAPRMLQDAFIEYHGFVPHHDFKIGQFKPAFGEEGIRSSSALDFVERSFIGQIGDARDLGFQVHGKWWDDRLQYHLGLFDGAATYQAGGFQNRADDNDEKDVAARLMIRPLWKNETWGSIELGYSFGGGTHGESAGANPIDNPVNGLNRQQSWAMRHNGWASYAPGGPLRGLWLKGEYAAFKDRLPPGAAIDLLEQDIDGNGTQDNGQPFWTSGFYVAMGYKLADGFFCTRVPEWAKWFELTARYDKYTNVQVADLVVNSHTDVFATEVYTAGINYYIKGNNAKIQLNYNFVDDPEGRDNAGNRNFNQHYRNDSFIVNFQVAF